MPFWSRTQHEAVPVSDTDQERELEQTFNGSSSDPDQPYDAPPAAAATAYDAPRLPGAYDFDANPAESRITPISSSDLAQPPPRAIDLVRERLRHTLFGRSYGRLSQSEHAGTGGNDGVFANLNAKPEVRREEYVGGDDEGGNSKELPPTYDQAAADSAPPYWETTIIAPTGFYGPDEILVDGLPIGNLFAFAWNMLVSCSFQFVGFLLTYLLHTTHAAKHGSRAGLGITLIQYSFYLKSRATTLEDELDNGEIPPELVGIFPPLNGTDGDASSWWDRPDLAAGPPDLGDVAESATASWASAAAAPTSLEALTEVQREGLEEAMKMSSMANDWLSYVLMAIGWALLFGAVFSYYKAWRYARAIRAENDAANPTADPPTISVIVA